MKKVKLQIPTGQWGDIKTKFSPDDSLNVGQNDFTDGTKNIDTATDGSIRKMLGAVEFASLTASANDQYEAIFSDGQRHLMVVENGVLKYTSGVPSMTTVTSGYSVGGNFEFATTKDRVYFGNGINANQVYDKTASYGGVSYAGSVPQTKVMGAQVPTTAPTAAVAAGAGVPAGNHTYKVTFLYYDAAESNPGPISNQVTVAAGPNQQVDLTSIPVGGYGVTARKIYRDLNGNGVYVLVGTINDNTTVIFSDNASAGTTPIPVDNGFAPAFGLVKLFLDRLFFGRISGEPFTLYFSEAGIPDVVESSNFLDCNPGDPITAIQVYRGRLVVFNRRSMGQILGSNRDSFRYDAISEAVGCVDTRTVQEVVLEGVPVLIWLSDKGFYGFNGSSIFYLSDSIENIVNSNIQQSTVQRNFHVDTTNADFNAGTPTDGIVIEGGQITTRGYVDGSSTVGTNPRRIWNDTADWDGGESLDNIVTLDQANKLTMVGDSSFEPATEGTKSGGTISDGGVGITLTQTTDYTGESQSGDIYNFGLAAAYPFIPTRDGSLLLFSTKFQIQSTQGGFPEDTDYSVRVWSDSGGSPGAVVFNSGSITTTLDTTVTLTNYSIGASLTGGTKYWIGIVAENFNPDAGLFMPDVSSDFSGGASKGFRSGSWQTGPSSPLQPIGDSGTSAFSFSAPGVSDSGTWDSGLIDTKSSTADVTDLIFTASYPTGTSSVTTVTAGDELDFTGVLIVDETQVINDHSGAIGIPFSSRRYYHVSITISTLDNREVPVISTAVQVNFSDTAEWISDIIDTTGDATTYNNLTTTSTTPGSSTVVTEIRTASSLGGIPGASWVAFGSVSVDKYAQIRQTLTKDGDNLPTVSLVDFDWTIVSNLVSEAIDTAVDPSGWDIFQTDFLLNGGTAVFQMRSAPDSGGSPGAWSSWYTVTNGAFPTSALPTDQWVQWQVTITSSDTDVPVVSSVTINWLVGNPTTLRAASIFDSQTYSVSLAEVGSATNNIIIQLDSNKKWRIKKGLGMSTLGFFFNLPYFGSSDTAVIGKYLEGLQDLGDNIEIDVRTRAFDFSNEYFDNSEFEKVPESFTLEGRGTGATYDVAYSLDNGATFINLVNAETGLTTYTSTDDNALFAQVFRVDAETNGFEGARTIMYRIHSDDEFDVSISRIKATAFITTKAPIITG